MNIKKEIKKELWEKHKNVLRDPIEIISNGYKDVGFDKRLLQYKIKGSFTEILDSFGITLFISREYEHLVIALCMQNGFLRQSFITLPHPTGIAINRKENKVFIAATRNPNQIIEFAPLKKGAKRIDHQEYSKEYNFLAPTRMKYFPGMYYFHDISVIGHELYATSVGQNGIIKIDFNSSNPDAPIWWPKCIENSLGKPDQLANYIQLNSIAGGKSIDDSFFSASSSYISKKRPGHFAYKVDGEGVIFSGKTRDVYAAGLTRPHSARLYNKKIWVDNSGYGEVGYIEKGRFVPIIKLEGWTRGMCIVNNILFVGTSTIIPKFSMYAPGLSSKNQVCGIHAIDMHKAKLLGSIIWPYGNQIFAIDWLNTTMTNGFSSVGKRRSSKGIQDIFYNYAI